METSTSPTVWTDESITTVVSKLRNDLIKDFLDERFLKLYINDNYKINPLSNVKTEFIRKELKALLQAPIDLNHYRVIYAQIKNNGSAALAEGNDQLFYREIETIIKRYIY